ncbi:MAG: type VI secretion system-associated protein TagF [Methylococcales bacterium]
MELVNKSGFYGKLPVLGDFVSRQLPNDFILSWDKWLQSSLAVSKEKLASDWMQAYLTSPIWRFALSPGLCGNDAWLGIVMPSVDRVGRYFPLTIACKVPCHCSLIDFFVKASPWFYAAEAVAISALEDDLSIIDFEQMVQKISLVAVKQSKQGEVDLTQDDLPHASILFSEYSNEIVQVNNINTQLASLLKANAEGYSLWSTAGSEQIRPGCMVLKGMPAVSIYTGFITGKFQQQEWHLSQQFLEKNTDSEIIVAKELLPEPEQRKQLETENPRDKVLINAIYSSPEQRASVETFWRSFSKTDKGNLRRLNEDAILDRPDLGLWTVADGMGGHKAGDLASRTLIHALNKLSYDSSLETSLSKVKELINTVNTELRAISEVSYERQIIGSTVVTLVASPDYFACLWAGDSRLYRLRDKQLVQLTVDHCEQNEETIELLGNYSASTLKQNNVITRAVGAFDELELDCQIIDTKVGDLYLLSSDGLDKEMTFNEIELVLNDNIYSDSVEVLLETVLSRKGRDNISVIVVEIMS